MNYQEMLKEARQHLNGSCKVCKACNGVACSGEVPGMGGKGTGSAFTENFKSLQNVKINMRVIHNVLNPDTSVELFGKKMKAPIFAAPVTGTTLNMGGKISEREYITSVVEGCIESDIYPMVGDTAVDSFLMDNLDVLKDNDGEGIVFIKPWENHDIIKKIKLAEEAGAYAVLLAVQAGADAIVVSNHGGRVLDCTPGSADVLPAIAEAVKGKITILADGGVRNGVDVLKMIGLGADGVLIGRPFVTASFGGGKEGVEMYVNKVIDELEATMRLTGCQSIKDIDGKVIFR